VASAPVRTQLGDHLARTLKAKTDAAAGDSKVRLFTPYQSM
jgi:hypothetical protein